MRLYGGGDLAQRPVLDFLARFAFTSAGYLPLAAHFSPENWLDFGPFWIQVARALHYAVYFAAGAGLGAFGLDRGLFDPEGKRARRWPLWGVAAVLSFAVAIAVLLAILDSWRSGGPGSALLATGNLAFVLCCAASSLAALALFVRFARRSRRWLDRLGANAFGIFLLHFMAVSWLQLALLDRAASCALKGLVVFAGAVAASWIATSMLRRIPALAKVL